MKRLSQTERELLLALASGQTEDEACRELGIQEPDFRRIWKKLCTRYLDIDPSNEDERELSIFVNKAERHRLHFQAFAAEARLRALLDTAPGAVLLVNGKSGIIIRVNQQVEPFFGYTMRQLVGKSVEMLIEDGLREIHVAYRKGFLSSNRKRALGYHPPIYAVKKDGTRLELAIALTSTPGTDEVMVICHPQSVAPALRAALKAGSN